MPSNGTSFFGYLYRKKFVFQWHITHRCNLRCKHCYQEDYSEDLEPDNLEKLRHYEKLSFIQISIDGARKKHNSIRGEGNYEKAFAAMKRLKKAGIQSMVSFTLSKENKDELKKVIRICERAKIDRFWTDRLIPIGSNQLDILTTEEYQKCLTYAVTGQMFGKDINCWVKN